jgi:hypothetical protein
MVPKILARQVISFQKDSFDKAFTVADMVQDLMEVWFAAFLEEMKWLPDDGIRFTDEWIGMRKRDRKVFKNLVDQTYEAALSMFAEAKVPASACEIVSAFNPSTKGGLHD